MKKHRFLTTPLQGFMAGVMATLIIVFGVSVLIFSYDFVNKLSLPIIGVCSLLVAVAHLIKVYKSHEDKELDVKVIILKDLIKVTAKTHLRIMAIKKALENVKSLSKFSNSLARIKILEESVSFNITQLMMVEEDESLIGKYKTIRDLFKDIYIKAFRLNGVISKYFEFLQENNLSQSSIENLLSNDKMKSKRDSQINAYFTRIKTERLELLELISELEKTIESSRLNQLKNK